MRKIILSCALMMTLVLLPSCGKGEVKSDELALSMRTCYLALQSCDASGEVTADYGERVYTYSASFSGNGLEGRMEITGPDNIAGTAVRWSEEGTSLEYEGVSLETGPLSADGLSPADGFPLILECCTRGAILESCREDLNGVETLRVGLQNPDLPADAESRVDVWVDPEEFTMLRAEVSSSGRTVLTFTFDTCQLS
jgi:outer membrane lipoprotein-sorting protein